MRVVDYVSQISESAKELKKLEDKENNGRIKRRLQLLRILKSGLTSSMTEACEMVGSQIKTDATSGKNICWKAWAGYGRLNYSRQKRGKLSYEQEAQVNDQATVEGFAGQSKVQTFIFEQSRRVCSAAVCRRQSTFD